MQVTVIKEIKANVLVDLRQLLFFTKILATAHFGTPHADADAIGTNAIHLSPDYLPAGFLFLERGFDWKHASTYLSVKGTAAVQRHVVF